MNKKKNGILDVRKSYCWYNRVMLFTRRKSF